MVNKSSSPDIIRIVFSVLAVSMLILGCFWVLSPFLTAMIWASVLVIPTWPVMLWIKQRAGGSRSLAVLTMTLLFGFLFFIPLWFVVRTIVSNTDTIVSWVGYLSRLDIPPPPAWVEEIPVVGGRISKALLDLSHANHEEITARITPYLAGIGSWITSQVGNFGVLVVHFVLTMIIAIILYWQGEKAADGLRAFGRRLANDRGEQSIILAGQAIKAVAMGIVITAFAQAIVAGIGLMIVGIPYAVLLTALIFAFSVVQIGAAPVMIPVVFWVYWSDGIFWGTFFLVWSVFALGLDNFLRPVLIRRGADLPLILIFAGVIGGLLSFGILGLFVGPVVLAVSYTLIRAWVLEESSVQSSHSSINAPT